MIDRIRASLTAKLFLITAAFLIISCLLTYSFIALVMPRTYQTTLTEGLTESVESLVKTLERAKAEDADAILDDFAQQTRAGVTLRDSEGNIVYHNEAQTYRTLWEGTYVAVTMFETDDAATDSVAVEPVEEVVQDVPEETAGAGDVTVTEGSDRIITVTENDGESQASTYQVMMGDVDVDVAEDIGAQSGTASVRVSTDDMRSTTFGQNFRFLGSDEDYILIVQDSMTEVNEATRALGQTLPYLALTILCVSLLGALLYSRYVTRPIVRISGIAGRLAALDFTWELDIARTDEIGMLAVSLRDLAERLNTAMGELRAANDALRGEMTRERDLQRRRTELFSAVSHELKTPITVIKGQLEGMIASVGAYADRDKYLLRTLKTAESMEKLVQEILSLSRAETAAQTQAPEGFALADVVRRSIAAHRELFRQRDMQVEAEYGTEGLLCGYEKEMEKAVGNLLVNAAQHSPPGESIRVRLAEDEGEIVLSVTNTGARIPEDALPHLLEAFYRVDKSRNRQTGGSGLGLYIASNVAGRHGGSVVCENVGEGVRVTLRVPMPLEGTQAAQ